MNKNNNIISEKNNDTIIKRLKRLADNSETNFLPRDELKIMYVTIRNMVSKNGQE